ncbi:hypothetical protein K458DRAFT_425268 [Lentithecium fluviatile CBS 122367]|uniref:Uncharacterized protein n=1 Tax=Lentithecium fluviatile CBS 122367 TaxID=1168545 RepID=A0A6G1IC00_9PLEO|nr:hypothetical protein K458DRAFT_425268 [Lentithecium fluviatile CBS 122367]
MLLQADPSLAEVPGFSPEQLAGLARSIELKKQKLESDIHAYIRKKQRELALAEQELLAQYRETHCGETRAPQAAPMGAEAQNPRVTPDSSVAAPQPDASPAESSNVPEEKKRTKHTRVHKREKELFGLVTPIFLPLLEAGDPAPAKKKEKKRRHKEKCESSGASPPTSEQGSPSRDAEKGKVNSTHLSKGGEKMEQDEAPEVDVTKEIQSAEFKKKSKRPAMKKSSLRKNSGERGRRKRVSLVIDDQIVLPADEYSEQPLTSPSETTISSTSNSTTSLDDMIDPRLLAQRESQMQEQHDHHDPVHHSLPLPTHLPSASPTKHTGHTLPGSPPTSPVRSPGSPGLYIPPQTTTRTFLEPSPPSAHIPIPQYASTNPIYATAPEIAEEGEEDFSTYVGGPSGSGVDDVDQTGSLGYPSSLGASYMESYMQSRPLSVRMAAADKAGLDDDEKEMLVNGGRQDGDAAGVDMDARRTERVDDDDEMDVIGSMEGF